MSQFSMIFAIEHLTSTPAARSRPNVLRVITPNVSRISWIDDSPLDHNQSDVISLDCTSLLECTQDISEIKDYSESSPTETTDDCSLATRVLNKGFVEYVQKRVNDKLRSEESKEYKRKEQLIYKLSKCFTDTFQENHTQVQKSNTMKRVLGKIRHSIVRSKKQSYDNYNCSRLKTVHVFYPFVSFPCTDVVDISKELGLLNGNTFFKEGKKCTWC